MNRYAYVLNNPLTWMDPTGFAPDALGCGSFARQSCEEINFDDGVTSSAPGATAGPGGAESSTSSAQGGVTTTPMNAPDGERLPQVARAAPSGGGAKAHAPRGDVAEWGFQFALGFGESFTSMVGGLAQSVRHPVDTAAGIGSAVMNPGDTGRAIAAAVAARVTAVASGDAHAIGQTVGNVVLLLAGGATANAAKELVAGARLTRAAEAVQAAEKSASAGIRVTEKGLRLVEDNLARVDHAPYNDAMIERLRLSLRKGERTTGADSNFYLHEISEGTFRNRGLGYDAAHEAAISKYGVSPFSLYHPDVIRSMPDFFNGAWRAHWGIQ